MQIPSELKTFIRQTLKKDIGTGDITTTAVCPSTVKIFGTIVARERGIVCGSEIIRLAYSLIDKKVRVQILKKDGASVKRGDKIIKLSGSARSILKGERTALNFISHLSGISTLASAYVKKTKGTRTKIFDTRKTIPGYRDLSKYAVRVGGGCNHRMGLYDQVLIKDNHFAALGVRNGCEIAQLVIAARQKVSKKIKIEVEVDSLRQLQKVLPVHPDIVLLDNMNVPNLKKAVAMIQQEKKRSRVAISSEASGGITLQTVASIARTGVDRISIGALTHSAPAIDFSLDII